MAKVTIVFGALLILLGIFGFIATGSQHYTALIPTWIGILLGFLGLLANSPDPKRRMLFMHIAVTVGLLSCIATFYGGIVSYIQMMMGKSFPYPAAVESKAIMSLLMLVFVILCVRSFVAARRARA
jgi:hypothetical protein